MCTVIVLFTQFQQNLLLYCTYRIHSGYYVDGRICTTCSYDGNSRGQLSSFQFVLNINCKIIYQAKMYSVYVYIVKTG